MPFTYALSITHFFSSVGADAGFAALIGLAILILLYFAHARETATLRDQLAAAMQRIEHLEHRLSGRTLPSTGAPHSAGTAGPSTGPVAAAPASANAPAAAAAAASHRPVSGQPAPVAPRPASAPPVVAPAGVGAPPLSDATRVVPVKEAAGASAALAAGPGARGLAGDGLGATPSPMTGATPSPVTAAAGGNGFAATRATDGAGGASRSLLEHGLPGHRKAPRWIIPALVVVVLAVIAVVLVLVLHSGSSNKTAASHRHHPVNIAAAPPGVVPSSVTVSVVNGTNINQLAHHVAKLLTGQSFKQGTLATFPNQSLTTTTVGYVPGQRNEALAVAHALKLPASAVRPASQSSEGLVCPAPSSCTADVIVVAGSNLKHDH